MACSTKFKVGRGVVAEPANVFPINLNSLITKDREFKTWHRGPFFNSGKFLLGICSIFTKRSMISFKKSLILQHCDKGFKVKK